ncbi:hypothetical protein J6590_048015 [Homalodisca vitripennis]|nr:hypothetical protein J6590_048015 [Homalodisca vitripennis]
MKTLIYPSTYRPSRRTTALTGDYHLTRVSIEIVEDMIPYSRIYIELPYDLPPYQRNYFLDEDLPP